HHRPGPDGRRQGSAGRPRRRGIQRRGAEGREGGPGEDERRCRRSQHPGPEPAPLSMAPGSAIEDLRDALKRLPGVGPKSAQRMAFHLLERDREGAAEIAEALVRALSKVAHCRYCNNFSESEICRICADQRRDQQLLCVVETPADLESIEQAGAFRGVYFVLMGHLAPLDGIGPEQLSIGRLKRDVVERSITEVVLATNLTVEGE